MTKPSVASLVVASVFLVGNAVGGQYTPQFGGTWRPFDLAITDDSQDITIRQDATTITIVEPGNPRTISVYRLDGSESRDGDRVARASWDGEKLVIDAATADLLTRTKILLSLNVWSTVLAVWHEDSGATQPTVYKKRLISPDL
jgi:hypothetical protein